MASPSRSGTTIHRVLSKLSDDLRRHFRELSRNNRHDELSRWTYCPPFRTKTLGFSLYLRRRSIQFEQLIVQFSSLNSRIAFTPDIEDLWFLIREKRSLRREADEVLTRYWKEREKRGDANWEQHLDSLQRLKRAWISNIDIDITVPTPRFRPPVNKTLLASLGSDEKVSGFDELHRVARNLDSLYPEDLERAVLREDLAADLDKLLDVDDSRPILLVGRAMVGKTNLIHEVVYRRVQRRNNKKYGGNIWLLSPQRLVSGMMYVGQWENRLLAILEEARKRGHVLYIDDVLGFFAAGVTCQSDLSMADVLKSHVQRERCKIVAEMTPETWRIFRERDRGFADLFQVVQLSEPSSTEVHRILIQSARDLENEHGCKFSCDVISLVTDLQKRHARGMAFPGKAVSFLRSIAIKHANKSLGRAEVLSVFSEKSGLQTSFVDLSSKLSQGEIRQNLSRHLIGQTAAIDAISDAISIGRARLNDPSRPLSTLLFLGPTGVGKTECAKVLSRYLYGSEDRLLRFDMNECQSSDDVAALCGSLYNPDGRLTSAVRRQPFSVVLFDEIEKGHPDVFDLLLQVLGEGRLTDGYGRTTDFTGAVIILTSNLGVAETAQRSGFDAPAATGRMDPESYLDAARRFFRPEFINRIDRVLPFSTLSRDEVRRIAELQLAEKLSRDGLTQRNCILRVLPAAMEQIVDQGFHPELGARALKRALEKQLVRPVAETLAKLPQESCAVFEVYPGPNGLEVSTFELVEAKQIESSIPENEVLNSDSSNTVPRMERSLERISTVLDQHRPEGPIEADLSREAAAYFILKEQLVSLREDIQKLRQDLEQSARPQRLYASRRSRYYRAAQTVRVERRSSRKALQISRDIDDYFDELMKAAEAGDASAAEEPSEGPFVRLAQKLALSDALIKSLQDPSSLSALLCLTLIEGSGSPQRADEDVLLRLAKHVYRRWPSGLEVTGQALHRGYLAIRLEGPGAKLLSSLEEGTSIISRTRDRVGAVQVFCRDMRAEMSLEDEIDTIISTQDSWVREFQKGHAAQESNPFPIRQVLRIYGTSRVLDLRTGLLFHSKHDVDHCFTDGLESCLVPLLPASRELEQ